MQQNQLEKTSNRKRSNKRKVEVESTIDLLVENDKSTPNSSCCTAPSKVPHPTYAEAVQTDGIANGYFSQQPSTGQSVLNFPQYHRFQVL